jgi:hypothetical protein
LFIKQVQIPDGQRGVIYQQGVGDISRNDGAYRERPRSLSLRPRRCKVGHVRCAKGRCSAPTGAVEGSRWCQPPELSIPSASAPAGRRRPIPAPRRGAMCEPMQSGGWHHRLQSPVPPGRKLCLTFNYTQAKEQLLEIPVWQVIMTEAVSFQQSAIS